MTAPAAPAPHRRVVRPAHGRLLGGVAAGIAQHLGLAPVVVRVAFVALALAGGVGLAMYAALWIFVPQHGDRPVVDQDRDRERDRAQLLAGIVVAVGGLLLLERAGLASPVVLPLLFAASGVGVVWAQADAAQRARWRSVEDRRTRLLAVLGGGLLLTVGLLSFLATIGELGQAREGLLSTLVVVVGLAVLTAPWWLRMTSDLRSERRERIRSQERAEVAAHVHDSVLQTLALIRKASEDPREINRLARTQERELRSWLYAPKPEAAPGDASLSAALEQAAAEVEEAHGVTVETVAVGDCPVTPSLQALVAATREALVNAARHSGAESVSLYAEVEAERVEVFVRDRGCGFDAAAVPVDRFGVSQSIVGRMERHGGTATVLSTDGGTEVRMGVRRG